MLWVLKNQVIQTNDRRVSHEDVLRASDSTATWGTRGSRERWDEQKDPEEQNWMAQHGIETGSLAQQTTPVYAMAVPEVRACISTLAG